MRRPPVLHLERGEVAGAAPDQIRAMIQPNTDLSRLIEVAYTNGMRPLRASAAAQVARGVTTIPEVVNVLPPAEF